MEDIVEAVSRILGYADGMSFEAFPEYEKKFRARAGV